MVKHESGIVNLLEKYFLKYRFTIYLDKNLIISGAFGFIISLIVAFISTKDLNVKLCKFSVNSNNGIYRL